MSSKADQKVYTLRFSEGFEWLLPVDDQDFERPRFDGGARAGSWTPVEMKRLLVWDDGSQLKSGDFYACSGGNMLVFSNRARASIGGELEKYGEVLPLLSAGLPFWVLNVTSFVDALDEAASHLVRASVSGRILMIRRFVPYPLDLAAVGLFKFPQTPRGQIYATEPFAEKVRDAQLVGLEFVQVWPVTMGAD